MRVTDKENSRPSTTGTGVATGTASVSIGAVVVATLGAACCSGPLLGPLIVAVLGTTGAAAFAGVKPYTPYLFGVSLVMLGVSFWSVYRKNQRCSMSGGDVNVPRRAIKTLLWIAAVIWAASVGFTLISLARS